jgi:hypothetical protein
MINTTPDSVKIIAFYLPQFHPIPENDEWWGKGFTEWTNVGKARKLFSGHYQPHIPADLGYYDLRLPESRKAQADMARANGIEGFCYWHYWFGNGKRLLEKPFKEVLKSGQPDFPFCLSWANETWSGIWHGNPDKILIEQTYPGATDHINHFNMILEAFLDPRYIRVDGKPLFVLYRPFSLPNPKEFIDLWQNLAIKNGLKGIFFAGISDNVTDEKILLKQFGFDVIIPNRLASAISKLNTFPSRIVRRILNKPAVFSYKSLLPLLTGVEDKMDDVFPVILPNWDNSPRSGMNALIIDHAKPELFKEHLCQILKTLEHKPLNKKLIFLKSWNEWAEGNYVEPDLVFGSKYLDVIKACMKIDLD